MEKSEFTVLVVDDETALLKIASEELNFEGYSVLTAEDAESGLETFKSNSQINIVISDIKMPGEDGVWLLEKILKLNSKMPVYLVSGYSNYSKQEVIERGARNLIKKPYQIDDLIDVIDHVFNKYN